MCACVCDREREKWKERARDDDMNVRGEVKDLNHMYSRGKTPGEKTHERALF